MRVTDGGDVTLKFPLGRQLFLKIFWSLGIMVLSIEVLRERSVRYEFLVASFTIDHRRITPNQSRMKPLSGVYTVKHTVLLDSPAEVRSLYVL